MKKSFFCCGTRFRVIVLLVETVLRQLVSAGDGFATRQRDLRKTGARQVVDMRKETKVGSLVLKRKAPPQPSPGGREIVFVLVFVSVLVIVPRSNGRPAVAALVDVQRAVGASLSLDGPNRHGAVGEIDRVALGVEVVGTVEEEKGLSAVGRQLLGAALVAHVEADAVVLSPLESHVARTRTGEPATERAAVRRTARMLDEIVSRPAADRLRHRAADEHHATAIGHHEAVELGDKVLTATPCSIVEHHRHVVVVYDTVQVGTRVADGGGGINLYLIHQTTLHIHLQLTLRLRCSS